MKLSTVLLFLFTLQIMATTGISQHTELSLKLDNAEVKEVLGEIENVSDVYFLYSSKLIDVNRRVSINVRDEYLDNVLAEVFNGENVNYTFVDKQIILAPGDAAPQPRMIRGTVTNEAGEALIGVSVIVKGKTIGTITNMNGEYELEVPDDAKTLIYQFIGMLTQEIPIEDKKSIYVAMVLDVLGLEEVVVIGYGTQKKVNLTGSVATISSDELVKRPIANVAQMMQGKLPGVSIFSNSGQPGNESTSIQIRGLNSFGSANAPIVLVDGVEGNLNDLDPDNIASISVLKDASSAAIYGSRAANGVILVTTKTGEAGTFAVKYHGNFAVHSPARLPELVTDPYEWIDMFNIANENAGGSLRFSDEIIQKFRSGELGLYNVREEALKNPFVQKHNLTMTGGTNKIRYSFAGGYWDQDGIVVGDSYKRYNMRLVIDSDINEYISFGANIAGAQGKRRQGAQGYTTQILSVLGQNRFIPAQFPDGRYVNGITLDEETGLELGMGHNPILLAENGGQFSNIFNMNGKAYLRINPFDGFRWETTAALKYDHSEVDWLIPRIPLYQYPSGELRNYSNGTNELFEWSPTKSLYTLFSVLEYKKNFNNGHNLGILGGYSQEQFRHTYVNGYRRDLPNAELMELNAGSIEGQTVDGSSWEWALQSFFGRLNYDIMGKYLVEVNFRYDGSSRFHKDNRWGLFPSISAGWRISEELFAQNIDWLSNFKIRASWGELGNQDLGVPMGDQQGWSRWELPEARGIYPYQSTLMLGQGYPFGGAIIADAAQELLANPDITWETTRITDIGLDLNIANGLFSLTFDYYHKLTSDILRLQQVMGHVGLSPPTINNGEMKNTGFDFIASHRQNIGDFSYGIDLIFSKFRNEVTQFGAKEIGEAWGNYRGAQSLTIREEGLPYDSWYMLEFDGIFQSEEDIANSPTHFYTPSPGDIKLKDQDGDGDVDMDDRTVIDGRYAKYSYGGNLYFNWKNFDLSLFLQGVQGIKRYVAGRGVEPFNHGTNVKWRDAWSPTNPSNELPILYAGSADRHLQSSSFFLQDASYLRLKNLQLGYNVPDRFLGNGIIKGLRVYVSGDNLLTFTSFEGDPERDKYGDRLWATEGNYPQLKIYSFGIKANF